MGTFQNRSDGDRELPAAGPTKVDAFADTALGCPLGFQCGDEFFDRESFTGPLDFWRKVTTYRHYFNLIRPNRGKEWQSPLQILNAKAPAIAGAVLHWKPLNLTQRHHLYLPKPNHRGHDLRSFPLFCERQRPRPDFLRSDRGQSGGWEFATLSFPCRH